MLTRWFRRHSTRAAIGQATRLFGSTVDYCLCTHGIDATRARRTIPEKFPAAAARGTAAIAWRPLPLRPPSWAGLWSRRQSHRLEDRLSFRI